MKQLLLTLGILTSPFLVAQEQPRFNIQLEVYIAGRHLEVYEAQFKNYLMNELAKIPDVKVVKDYPTYIVAFHFYELPCDCGEFDFHYRGHFVGPDVEYAQYSAFSEGFNSSKSIETWAKNTVSTLNVYQLQRLR